MNRAKASAIRSMSAPPTRLCGGGSASHTRSHADRCGVVDDVERLGGAGEEAFDETGVELTARSCSQFCCRTTATLPAAEQFGDVGDLHHPSDERDLVTRSSARSAGAVPALEGVAGDPGCAARHRQQCCEPFGRVALGGVVASAGDGAVAEQCADGRCPVGRRCVGCEAILDQFARPVRAGEVDLCHHCSEADVVAGAVAVRLLDGEPRAAEVAEQGSDHHVGDQGVVARLVGESSGEHGRADGGLVCEAIRGVAGERERSQQLDEADRAVAHAPNSSTAVRVGTAR